MQYNWNHPATSENEQTLACLAIGYPGRGERRYGETKGEGKGWLAAASNKLRIAKHPCLAAQATNPNPCRCLLYLHTLHHNRTFKFVIDSGASVNLVDPALLSEGDTRVDVPPLEIKGISGQRQPLTQQVTLTFELGGYPYSFDFYVAPGLPVSAILGLDAIIESGWMVDAIHRRLLHVNHALPPIKLAPCAHTALLAYAAEDTVVPARAWKHVAVRNPYAAQFAQMFSLVCFTPTPPEMAPMHGAPTAAPATASVIPLLICNTGEEPILVPKEAPLAYLEGCEDPAEKPRPLAAPSVGGKERGTEKQQGQTEKVEQQKWKGKRLEEYFDLASAKAHWPQRYFNQLKEVLREAKPVWEAPEIVGRAKKGEHRIETGDALPVAQQLRRVAWTERDVIQKEV